MMSLKCVKKIVLCTLCVSFFGHSLVGVPPAVPSTTLAALSIAPIKDMGAVTGDGSSKFRTYFSPKQEVPLGTSNAKLFVGAMINADYYFLRRAETLDADNNEDARSQFRQRTELSMLFKYGTNNEHDRGIVETKITLGNTLFMRSLLNPRDYHNSQVITGSPFDYNFSPLHVQFQEAWVQVNFDRIVANMEKRPHFLKIGYFPHLVGRGISLGDWSQGGVDYMGFNKSGIQTYAPMYPPGILWRGEITKYSCYDVYFSPLVSEDLVAANYGNKVAVNLPKESLLSRHIFSTSAKLGCEFKDMSASMAITEGVGMVNPYWVYYNSPRQSIDHGADAPINMHTFGCMAEMSAGGFEFNVEIAKQIGRQTVRETVYKDYPSVQHFHPTTGAFRPLPTSEFAKLPAGSVNPNRWFRGDNYPSLGALDVYWQELDESSRLHEHHPAYDINLSGWMAMFDSRYSFKDYPVIVAVAGGYFSGDCYPYNDNIDNYFGSSGTDYHNVNGDVVNIKPEPEHSYRGFLPLRDREYCGLWVHPLVLVNAGIVPRPKGLDLFDLQSRNDTDTLTNLVYIGTGIALRPLKDQDKLRLNANLLCYWNDDRLKKWDKKATPPERLVQNEGVEAGNKKLFNQLGMTGWEGTETASKFLGWEINAIVSYKISKNLDVSLRGGIFFPGQFYSDTAGQPNPNTVVDETVMSKNMPGKLDKVLSYKGLGQDIAYGFYMRLRYVF